MAFKYPAARRDETKVSVKVPLAAFSVRSVCLSAVISGSSTRKARPGRERRVLKTAVWSQGYESKWRGDEETKTKLEEQRGGGGRHTEQTVPERSDVFNMSTSLPPWQSRCFKFPNKCTLLAFRAKPPNFIDIFSFLFKAPRHPSHTHLMIHPCYYFVLSANILIQRVFSQSLQHSGIINQWRITG